MRTRGLSEITAVLRSGLVGRKIEDLQVVAPNSLKTLLTLGERRGKKITKVEEAEGLIRLECPMANRLQATDVPSVDSLDAPPPGYGGLARGRALHRRGTGGVRSL